MVEGDGVGKFLGKERDGVLLNLGRRQTSSFCDWSDWPSERGTVDSLVERCSFLVTGTLAEDLKDAGLQKWRLLVIRYVVRTLFTFLKYGNLDTAAQFFFVGLRFWYPVSLSIKSAGKLVHHMIIIAVVKSMVETRATRTILN